MKDLTICDNCGTLFLKEKKEKDRRLRRDADAKFFCSHECVIAGKRRSKGYPDRIDNCRHCGQEFVSKRHNRKQGYSQYCSRSCAATAGNEPWHVKKVIEDF